MTTPLERDIAHDTAIATKVLFGVALQFRKQFEAAGHSPFDSVAMAIAAFVDATTTLAKLNGMDPEKFTAMLREAFDEPEPPPRTN